MPTDTPKSRPPLARIARIHEMLQHGKAVNCSTLAEQLEVSVKTAQRDLEFMRDQLKYPIEYDRADHRYQLVGEVPDSPVLDATEGEVMALLVAQKALEQYRGTPFERMLDTAFSKIASSLRSEISFNPSEVLSGISFRAIGTAKADLETFEALSRAVRQRREVSFDYRKPGAGKPERRQVQPHHLASIQNLWYAICFDPKRNAFRSFALPRIGGITLTRTKFERQKDFSAEKALGGGFGAFGGTEDIEVKVRFDAFAAPFIRERSWHSTEQFKPLANGALEMTLKVPRLEEIQTWVLGWGGHAIAIAPKPLVEAIAEAASKIATGHGRARSQ